jgi:hypothetical protein
MDESAPTDDERQPDPSNGTRHCRQCGASIDGAARFCAGCGTPQIEPPTGPVGAPSPPQPTPDGMIPIAQIGPSGRITVSKRALIVALVALAVVGLGTAMIFTVLKSTDPRTETITGSITLFDDDEWRGRTVGTSCSGSGGYSDMRGGAPVVVRDENDELIGSSFVSEGVLETSTSCSFSFVVEGVRTSKFYAVTLISERRGAQTLSHDDLTARDWRLDLSLGK